MNQQERADYKLWLLAACGAFIALNLDSMWSSSVDLAHHYSLVFRILEQWVLTSTTDPSLGEMNVYPRGGHVIAAAMGSIFNSAFIGIHLTALFSLGLLWLSAVLLLNSLPGAMAIGSLIALTALAVLNAAFTKFDLHGRELVGNFFYSQLLAQSLLFVAILGVSRIERKAGALWAAATLTVVMMMVVVIHLLPAVEMLGVILGLLAIHVLVGLQSRKWKIGEMAICLTIAIVAVVGIAKHPAFAIMRGISQNNGGLELSNMPYPLGVIGMAAIAIFASIALLFLWNRSGRGTDLIVVKYIAIYGGATAALCFAQFALTFVGQGSDYAVKKYAFALTSILLLQFSIFFGWFVWVRVSANADTFSASRLRPIASVAALSAILFVAVRAPKALDVSDLTRLEQRLVNIADTMLPAPSGGKHNVVIGLDGLPNTVNYMFSTAVAKTPRELAVPDVLMKNDLTNFSNYEYVISTSFSRVFGSAGCDSITKGVLSVVPAECIRSRREKGGVKAQ